MNDLAERIQCGSVLLSGSCLSNSTPEVNPYLGNLDERQGWCGQGVLDRLR